MSPKELKKLAAACRAAGILTFKNSEVEFTLSEDKPRSNYTKRTQKAELPTDNSVDPAFIPDSLTDDQLLMWSTGSSLEEGNTQ